MQYVALVLSAAQALHVELVRCVAQGLYAVLARNAVQALWMVQELRVAQLQVSVQHELQAQVETQPLVQHGPLKRGETRSVLSEPLLGRALLLSSSVRYELRVPHASELQP